jgi:hypothetical protein
MGLPTIDDLNLVWDIRPIFEEPAFAPEPSAQGYEKLVSTTSLLILEISATREDGQGESKTYQLSEDDFDRLFESLKKARRQLEIIKKTLLV